MKKIVLFDMDGTLTPPRQELVYKLLGPLKTLSHYCEIGVVTGSDMDYLQQQIELLLINTQIRYKLHLLPCNGTKHYSPPMYNHEKHKLVLEKKFKDKIGKKSFNLLMKILIEYQNHLSYHYEFPLTGHFISYRESMINWCPIGRNAEIEEREEFINLDKNFRTKQFRKIILEQITEEVKNLHLDVTVKLGGETSFDIYPTGWDKTFALQHFPNYKIWFIGDKCHAGGNDEEIFKALNPNSFSVETPEQTEEILTNILIPLFAKGDDK